jgi:hypothetical protein
MPIPSCSSPAHLAPQAGRDRTVSSWPWRHAIWVFVGFMGLFTVFFAPIVFQDFLFGHGDGLSYYLAAYLSPLQLWTDLIFGGYPIAADPQIMTWYPPALLLRWIPGSWNWFNILGFGLAASFAYCYSFITTGSRIAAIGAGLTYSLGGFVVGHLSHTTGVHSAAWIPLFLAALERLRSRFDRRWWGIGIGAIASCMLAGHTQVALYAMGLGVLYALVMSGDTVVGWRRYLLSAASMMAMGLLLCAIQLLPSFELMGLSVRAAMPFEVFATQYALPNWQAVHMLFPYLFGGAGHAPYGAAYWGKWLFVDIVGYVGLMPLMLAAIALLRHRSRRLVWFWAIFGIVTFLLALGGDTPLAKLLYHVPLYNKFRSQGRHLVTVAIAASALTGFGLATIQRHWISRRLISLVIAGMGSLMALAWSYLYWQKPFFQGLAAAQGIVLYLTPWRNPAIGIPLLTFGLSSLALLLFAKHAPQRWVSGVLGLVLLWDLASCSWFWPWHPPAAKTASIQPPEAVVNLRDRLNDRHQRLFTSQGAMRAGDLGIAPNMTRAWQLPNASGYTPLLLSRVAQLLQINQIGVVHWPPAKSTDRSFDLMAIRYLLMPPPLRLQALPGLQWAGDDIPLTVGNGTCEATPANPVQRLELPSDGKAVSAIGIVSQLSCATQVWQDATVAEIEAVGVNGQVVKGGIRAGQDTAEWAYDCLPAQAKAQHQRAPIFRQMPGTQPNCQSNSYVSVIPLPGTQPLKQLAIKSTIIPGIAGTRLDIQKLTLVHPDNTSSKIALPFGLTPNLAGTERWQTDSQLADGTVVYENQFALPRAWLVPELVQLSPAAILRAIQTAQLPDGRSFDPRQMALVENVASQKLPNLQPTDIVKIDTIANTQVKLQTKTGAPAFLILSDVDYPGWQVTIDGKTAPLLRVNYVLRGVQVPVGTHTVQFAFRPRLMLLGMGISGLTLLSVGVLIRYRVTSC